jgi:hypothetical protein
MTNILATATSTDLAVFQMGMNAARDGVPFDPFSTDEFWKQGWIWGTELNVSAPIRRQFPASRSVRNVTPTQPNT